MFAPLIAKRWDLAISAFYGLEGSRITYDGIPVMPGLGGEFGNQVLVEHARHHFGGDPRGGLVFTLMDVWVLSTAMARKLNMVSWTPVDHEPAPPNVIGFFRGSGAVPMAMSRFGERMLTDAGLEPLYVPHGVDTDVMRPHSRSVVRRETGVPEHAFLVGMVAANKGRPSRKGFTQALQAFAAFRQTHDDAILYLHTVLDPGHATGEDLPAIIRALGIPSEAVLTADQYRMMLDPFAPSSMAKIFSSMDVLLNPAAGEGFGIPIMEAQACFPAGTPVRVENPVAGQCRPYTGRLVKIETARGSFEATVEHPVWTQRGWQSAESIRPGDQLLYSYAPERLDEVHAGAIERVAASLQDDAVGGGGGARWDDARSGILAVAKPRVDAEVIVGLDRDEAAGNDRTTAALLRRVGGWRGHGHDPADQSRQGTECQLQAIHLRGEYGQAHDGLDRGADPFVMGRYASADIRGSALIPSLRGGAGTPTSLPGAATRAGRQGRLDGGGYRVVRDTAIAVTAGPLDDAAARDRLADPRAEYDTVTAVSERDVRDLPVYNFTTRSGVYEVGAGYLVHNCGTPAIVTNFSAMPEVCGAGWHVGCRTIWTGQNSWQVTADVEEIVAALEQAHNMPEADMERLRRSARKHALGYDVVTVAEEHMLPALEEAHRRFEDRAPTPMVAA